MIKNNVITNCVTDGPMSLKEAIRGLEVEPSPDARAIAELVGRLRELADYVTQAGWICTRHGSLPVALREAATRIETLVRARAEEHKANG
jgi:hypothetical protein